MGLRVGAFWISGEQLVMLPRELGSYWHLLKLIELVGLVAVRELTLWSRDRIRKYGRLSKHVHDVLTGHARVAQDSWSLAWVSLQLLSVELVSLLRGHGGRW